MFRNEYENTKTVVYAIWVLIVCLQANVHLLFKSLDNLL